MMLQRPGFKFLSPLIIGETKGNTIKSVFQRPRDNGCIMEYRTEAGEMELVQRPNSSRM